MCVLGVSCGAGPAGTRTEARSERDAELLAPAPVATFSIVARDPETGDLGVAVQSRFFGVGAVVPWARAGVGAVATQARANTTYGPRALEMLAAGESATAVLDALIADDDRAAERQVGLVDAAGRAAAFSGEACLSWAGDRTGDGYAVQGNILAGPGVVDAMAVAYEITPGDLASRMLAALEAGQAAGGDARGRQSAALLVVRAEGGYDGLNDRYIDLRVDDHPAPIRELRRLLDIRHGQLAAGEGWRLLRAGDVDGAVAAAREATRRNPADGYAWMLLAGASLAAGDQAGAADAGRRALLADPWLKSAAVSGTFELPMLDRLLELEEFARLWEAIPTR